MFRRFADRVFTSSRPKMIANLSVASVATVAFIVAATRSDGYHATNVDLNDGTVWVTNESTGQVARLNIAIRELDFGLSVAGPDVVQDGRNVFAADGGGMFRIDPVTGGAKPIPNGLLPDAYEVGGGVGIYYDAASGRLWTGPAGALAAPEYPRKADGELAPGSLVVLTQTGRLLATDRDTKTWFEVALDDQLKPLDPNVVEGDAEQATSTTVETTTVPPTPDVTMPETIRSIAPLTREALARPLDADTVASAVGDTLVFLDADGTVYGVDGDAAQVPGTQFRLQAPGPEDDRVLVASDEGLFAVELGGDDVEQLSGLTGAPAQPVRVGRCAYGAWSGKTPTWFRDCPGVQPLADNAVPDAVTDGPLRFRVNQSNVALNQTGTGGVWTEHDGRLVRIDNWGDVDTDDATDDVTDTGQNTQDEQEVVCVTDAAVAPTAGDDPDVGLRNRQTLIDVLTNDADQNCDPIAIVSLSGAASELGRVEIVDNGQHLLFTPGPGVQDGSVALPQPFTFGYVVGDTAGLQSAAATVTAVIRDPGSTNQPPQLRMTNGEKRKMRTVVESGKVARYNVLADWFDPDGDELRLVSARSVSGVGEVSFAPDGTVRFAANGVGPGIQQVEVVVSDGIGAGGVAELLEVTVQTDGQQIKPVAQHDFITLTAGESGLVLPLSNDYDGNGETLSFMLGTVPAEAGVRAALTADARGVEVTGVSAGVWPIPYTVSDGTSDGADATDQAVIRVTVLAKPETNAPPVAVPDRLLIKPGRVVNVDVLANDLDADGDLLAIVNASQSLPTETGGGVRVSVVDRKLLQVELVAALDGSAPVGPFEVSYQIDDGQGSIGADGIAIEHTSSGTLNVLVDPALTDQPPVPADDAMVVRASDVASLPVTANDVDPDGDRIELVGVNAAEAETMAATGSLIAWTDGQRLYVRGGNVGRYVLHYDVIANGRTASGQVSVEVRALPTADAPNSSPTAKDIDVRAVRGGTVRIKVPTDGLDPDGDAVRVDSVGQNAQATFGARAQLADEPNVLLYTVDPTSTATTDSFTYTVRDAYGGFNEAMVRVVIVDVEPHPPVAHDDVWRVRPGRELVISVLANDVDADDDQLSLAEQPFFDVAGQPSTTPQNAESVSVLPDGETPELRGRLAVIAPAEGGLPISERYRVTDGTSFGDAYVRAIADPSAPNMKPVAVPDVVQPDEVRGKTTIDVPVLENGDVDPDDAAATLTVDIPSGQPDAAATTDGTTVSVALLPHPQLIVYRITDSDPDAPASAYATVSVPGLENHPPELSAAGKDPATYSLKADDAAMRIDLSVTVTDPDGDPGVRLTDTEVVSATGATVTRSHDLLSFSYQPRADAVQGYDEQIAFEVIDRPDDPGTAKTAQLVIQFHVEPAGNTAPTVQKQGAVSVPFLDEPVTYDLAPLTRDEQNDALTFAVTEAPAGFEVAQSNSQLTITGIDENHEPGQGFRLRYTVTDDVPGHEPVPGEVTITVTRTNRGMPAASAIGPLDAVLDQASAAVDVVSQATNPFPDKPLTIVSVNASGGSVSCATECGQSPIVYTPSTIGTQTVTYTVRDVAEQIATGTITYVVKGKPLAPGVPTIGEVSDRTVNLTWTAADPQGGTISEYVVTTDSGMTMTSPTTSLAFTGLTNATQYKFSVYAVNEIGAGPASAPSNVGIPDRVPSAPENPRFTDWGDGTLMLAWEPPSDAANYSAIKNYRVTVQGGPTQIVAAPTTTLTVTGLANGTAYTFSVEAQNDATANGGWGAASGRSPSEIPSRHPDPPVNVQAVAAGDGGTPRVTVTWSPPAFNGGREITSYDVCPVDGSGCQNGVNSQQATFTVGKGSSNAYTVVAHNSDSRHRNNSDPSAASNAVQGIVTPGAPTVTAVDSGDHTLTVRATPGDNGGCSSSFLEYTINGGGSWQTSNVFGGLTNGQSYTAAARMTVGSNCAGDLGPGASPSSGTSNTMANTPYGALRQPTMNASASGTTLYFHWDASQGDNGRPASFSLSGDCPNGPTSPVGDWNPDVGYSQTRSCTITVSAPGVSSLTASGSARSADPPQPTLSVSKCSGTWVCGSGDNYTPGTRWYVECSDSGGPFVNTQTGLGSTQGGWAPRYADGNGHIGWSSGQICFSDEPVTVRLWTTSGQSRTASTG